MNLNASPVALFFNSDILTRQINHFLIEIEQSSFSFIAIGSGLQRLANSGYLCFLNRRIEKLSVEFFRLINVAAFSSIEERRNQRVVNVLNELLPGCR